MRQLWRLPGFGRLSVAYALNELAWFVGTLSLSLLVYRRTGSALGSAGFFLCSQGAPALLAPALVGRLDRFSPRVLLPALYFTEAILFGVLAYLAHRFVLAPVLVLVVVDGVIALVARSLSSGARTEILKPVGLVREGGALQSMMFSTAYLVGPLIGGAVAAAGGTVAALIVDCGLFAAMGLSLISPTIPRDIVHDGPQQRRLRAAVGYVRGNAPIARMLGLQTVAYACFSLPTPIEVVLCVRTLHAGSAGYGGLMAAWGGGAVLGSLLYARWRRRSVRLIIGTATVAMAIGFGVMSQSPDITVALVGAAVAGIGNGVAASAFGTEMMEIVPQSWVALVMSLNQSLGVLAPGIGIALGGLLTALFDVRATFGIAAGASVLLAGLVVWLLAPAKLAAPEDGPGDGADSGGASGPQSGIPAAASQGGGPARVGGSETDAATLA